VSDVVGGKGNSGFDLAFLALELVALLASLVLAGIGGRRGPGKPGLVAFQIGVGLVASVVVPTVWNVGWPAVNRFEGAGRFLFGGAASGLNAVVCAAACAFSPRLSRGAKLLNAIGQLAAAGGYWGVFLVH
jgi:hypothetical protein